MPKSKPSSSAKVAPKAKAKVAATTYAGYTQEELNKVDFHNLNLIAKSTGAWFKGFQFLSHSQKVKAIVLGPEHKEVLAIRQEQDKKIEAGREKQLQGLKTYRARIEREKAEIIARAEAANKANPKYQALIKRQGFDTEIKRIEKEKAQAKKAKTAATVIDARNKNKKK